MAAATPSLRIGGVTLVVHDLAAVAGFYRDTIGLVQHAADADRVRLGSTDDVFLELQRDPLAPKRSADAAGLFHTAFLLPSRGDLARWLRHAAARGVALQGASDHAVSEAVYLADPEGNGIEIYADRPAATWPRVDGMIAMVTERLDIDDLMGSAGPEAWQGVPPGTTIGHVHLQVGAIPAAEAFYGGVLGMPLTARYPGGSFFATDGYHHQLAANVWHSRGAPRRDDPTTGLADLALRVTGPGALDAIAARSAAADVPTHRDDGRLALRDPWGTSLTLVSQDG